MRKLAYIMAISVCSVESFMIILAPALDSELTISILLTVVYISLIGFFVLILRLLNRTLTEIKNDYAGVLEEEDFNVESTKRKIHAQFIVFILAFVFETLSQIPWIIEYFVTQDSGWYIAHEFIITAQGFFLYFLPTTYILFCHH